MTRFPSPAPGFQRSVAAPRSRARLGAIPGFALSALLLAACAGPGPAVALGPQTWIDAPLDGAMLADAPYLVVAHATHPDGLSALVLMVDGEEEGQVQVGPDQAGQTLVEGSWEWDPAGPGFYTLESYALTSDGTVGPSAVAHVTVPAVEVTPTPTPTPATAAPPTPTPTPAALSIGDPVPSADVFFYGRNECGPKQITIDVALMGGDPADGPFNMVMFFRLADPDSDRRTEWTALSMNPGGEGMFSRTLMSQTDIPDFNMFVLSWLQVQFVAEDGQGVEVARTTVFPMVAQLSRCPR